MLYASTSLVVAVGGTVVEMADVEIDMIEGVP